MHNFIDRRENPAGKSLGNRQRFIRRAREQIKEVVNKSVRDRKIGDLANGGNQEIIINPPKGTMEPTFRPSRKGGVRRGVFPGNKEYVPGDRIAKPRGGNGGAGKEGSDQGEGEDGFQFTLTHDEFLDIFFEDLELPDLVKTNLKEITRVRWQRAGFAKTGTPSNLDVMRTMRNSLGRRIALGRLPSVSVAALMAGVADLKAGKGGPIEALLHLEGELDRAIRRQRIVAYIDPVDVRFRQREPVPEPNTRAVMFCLMDVSGSMGEREKDLAKRFFILLHMFLKRRYERIEVVFIRHTHEAQEVDEDTFFYSRQTGGTVVSTALHKMHEIIKEWYPTSSWNIYVAQASDGENSSGDSDRCVELLRESIMPLCQHYAYIEILDEREFELFGNQDDGRALWRSYKTVGESWKNFAMKRIAKPADIYPVFRELFEKRQAAA